MHQLNVLALAIIDYRGQQHDARAFRQFKYLVDHLTDGLCFQRYVVIGTTRCACPCE